MQGSKHYVHANALVIGETGLLLRGPSGAGKSMLTLELIAQARLRGDFARLVADDRVQINSKNGRLIARPHPEIAGMIETRGLGLVKKPYEPACILNAIIDLDPASQAPSRYPEESEKKDILMGISLPRLRIGSNCRWAATVIHIFIQ